MRAMEEEREMGDARLDEMTLLTLQLDEVSSSRKVKKQ
jgi:hypothetical protein